MTEVYPVQQVVQLRKNSLSTRRVYVAIAKGSNGIALSSLAGVGGCFERLVLTLIRLLVRARPGHR